MSLITSNRLIPFEFEGAAVRTVLGEDSEPWFVARDVAAVLGYANGRKAVADHCKGVTKRDIPTASGIQTVSIIPERDVYRLIMRSKLPSAERFEEWVVGEVLPSIRKTGSYSAVDLNNPNSLRTLLLDYTEKMIALEAKVQADAPKVEFHDKYATADGCKGVREVAKMLHAKQNEFVAFLISQGIMYRLHGVLAPIAHHHHAGRFIVKAGVSANDHAFNQAMFTPKGVTWIAAEWACYNAAIEA